MTIKELVHKLTHITIYNPNDLSPANIVLNDDAEIGKVIILKDKTITEVDFDEVFSSPTLYPENTVNIFLRLDDTCDIK
jgi:hypothetical protein